MITTLLNENTICLDLKSQSKNDMFFELAELLLHNNKITNTSKFVADIVTRENEGNTGFEEGIALPHAKSDAVLTPAIAIGISRDGIEYGSEDGKPARFIFMIASPVMAADHHIQVLASLASKFIEEGFTEKLMKAKTASEVFQLLTVESETKSENENIIAGGNKPLLIGVTGCPAGIAHTYLAAESLKKTAQEQGYDIVVETNGSIGIRNSPTQEQINRALAVMICSDKPVEMDRFTNKKVLITNVKAPIKSAAQVIEQSLSAPIWDSQTSVPTKQSTTVNRKQSTGQDLYKYLMNGVSHMIPFVVTGGLMIALSLTIGGVPGTNGLAIPADSIWNTVLQVGSVAFQLMIPILAAYIAFAIGERPALAPGFIGGWIANTGSFYGAAAGTGFIGAIIAGLLVGYLVRWIIYRNWHRMLQPLVPILIAPLLGTLFISILFIFVIGAPIAGMMNSMNTLLVSLSGGSLVLLGIVIGGMAGFDMGGPFNKVAVLFCIGMLSNGHMEYMGAIACAIPVAPLGMGLATFVTRKTALFGEEENEAGKASFAMGLMGISEGAIPFAARDPLSVIPANVIGSMVASVIAFLTGVTDAVAHGGPIVVLLGAVNNPVAALIAMASGTVVTTTIVVIVKLMKSKRAGLAQKTFAENSN